MSAVANTAPPSFAAAPLAVPPPGWRPAWRAAPWLTLAVAALAAITQAACTEPRDELAALGLGSAWSAQPTADAAPGAGTANPAPAAGDARCDAWRQADRLDARLALDYRQQRALPSGGQLRQRHGADVQATLALLQRDETGAVWSGPVQQGQLALDDRIDGTLDHAARQLAGRGLPRSGQALAGSVVTVRVEFADCRLRYAARLALDATARQAGQTLAVPLQELGRVSVSQPGVLPTLAADGQPALAGSLQVPAQTQLLDSGYRPGGLATAPALAGEAATGAPAGRAQLRWRFTPLRASEGASQA